MHVFESKNVQLYTINSLRAAAYLCLQTHPTSVVAPLIQRVHEILHAVQSGQTAADSPGISRSEQRAEVAKKNKKKKQSKKQRREL